ncbi:MAG: hypothetical protein EOO46_01210 [Flavobacterium sp.]|nr:MAG: hypothetical protein EOO46_01210 [Flavobacterium sp.]
MSIDSQCPRDIFITYAMNQNKFVHAMLKPSLVLLFTAFTIRNERSPGRSFFGWAVNPDCGLESAGVVVGNMMNLNSFAECSITPSTLISITPQ